MNTDWETEIVSLLQELSDTQQELLNILAEKREMLVRSDLEGMKTLQPREEEVARRLMSCHQTRGKLLARAAEQGLPGDSIRSLAEVLPTGDRKQLSRRVQETASRFRILQHQSLTNWVVAQRTLIHLSQLLEIIATRGRQRTTYGKGDPLNESGALMDHAA